jgi:hypothetical protein
MNQLFIPILRAHLETVWDSAGPVRYALLEPQGEVSPLRIRFDDLRAELVDRFSPELSAETIIERIGQMQDEQLLLTVTLRGGTERGWSVCIRPKYPFESRRQPVNLSDQRRSRRHAPAQPSDVRLSLGEQSLEGIIYNVSEHGLGIAVWTTQVDQIGPFALDKDVHIEGGQQRVTGLIRSQYPAAGGCVLGIELKERLLLPGLARVKA